jgi:hypothetical protein
MPINLDTPIELPAQPARTADKLWLLQLNLTAPSATAPAMVVASVAPYVSATGEILVDQARRVVIEDVLAKAQTDAVLAATMQTLFAEIERQARLAQLF